MAESPLMRSARQRIVSETESQLGPEITRLQALGRDDLTLLQLVVLKELTSPSMLSSVAMLAPSRVEDGLQHLKNAGLIVERSMGSQRLIEATPASKRLRRAIAAME